MFEKYKLPLIYLATFLLGFLGSYFGLKYFNVNSKSPQLGSPTINNYNNIFDSAETSTVEPKTFNAVLLGSGGAGHSGGGLTDSIIVIQIDSESKKAALISIPRDLWVNGNYKINAAVTNVGLTNLKGVIQNITGIEIEKYASVDFGNLIKIIDNLGGIEVEVPKTFTDNFYPIKGLENETCGKTNEEIASLHSKYSGFELEKQFTCRYETISFEKGVTKIDGSQALKFARSRHGDSDFGRSERQFAILLGVVKKLSTQSPFKTISDAFENLSRLVSTDMNISEAEELFNLFGSPDKYDIKRINLSDQNVLVSGKGPHGEYILQPKLGKNNFEGIREFIKTSSN